MLNRYRRYRRLNRHNSRLTVPFFSVDSFRFLVLVISFVSLGLQRSITTQITPSQNKTIPIGRNHQIRPFSKHYIRKRLWKCKGQKFLYNFLVVNHGTNWVKFRMENQFQIDNQMRNLSIHVIDSQFSDQFRALDTRSWLCVCV